MIHMPSGAARRVDGHGLAADDRRLGGEKSALGLVDCARDAVEPRRDVDDRGASEALVAPASAALVEREVDLHLAAPVAEAPRRVGDRRGNLALARAARP